jgi:hypothetical protein
MVSKHKLLKKILKAIGWTIFSIILLLVTIILLIRVPFIQNKIVHYATNFVSKKTHTKVEIGSILINFPKSISLTEVFLDDLNKDTLLYAGKLEVNISLLRLLNNKIEIRDITVENIVANIQRQENDSLFNYNFLITAFTDPTKTEKKDTSATPWEISVGDVNLKNISLRYNDEFGGHNVKADLGSLKLKMDQTDLEQQLFSAGKLEIDRLYTHIIISKAGPPKSKKVPAKSPVFSAKRIQITNSGIILADSLTRMLISARISDFGVDKLSADLSSQTVKADNLELNKSLLSYLKTDSTSTTASENKAVPGDKGWSIHIRDIDLADNSISYNLAYIKVSPKTFNASHLDYKGLTLKAKDFQFSNSYTAIKVKGFSASDANGFRIEKFETEFAMTPKSIIAKDLKLKTGSSSINGKIELGFSSLGSLKDSIQFLEINSEFRKISVMNSDIIYFSPQLIKQPFFANTRNITTVSGKLNGTLNNLTGKDIEIHTGSNTIVKTNFIIAGLPYAETAYFNLPDLKVNTGKNDIIMIAGTAVIPSSIELPEQISLQINFKGFIKEFTAKAGIGSSFGSANIFAITDKKENFNAKAEVNNFDLGKLLKNPIMFGPVSLNASAIGKGFDKNTIAAAVKAEASEIYLNKYTYKDLTIDGKITGQKFDGEIKLEDPNAEFDFKGFVNLNKNQEEYKFSFDLKGADLKKLHLRDDDLRIGLLAVSDLKGNSASTMHGKAGITKIVIAHNEKKYILDSLLFASINEKGRSELNVSSALIGIKYNGSFAPADMPKEIQKFIDKYFLVSDERKDTAGSRPQNFDFEIELHNHPVISEVFLPQLKSFEPGTITGSFNSEKQDLKFDATVKEITYGGTHLDNFSFNISSDINSLNYRLNCGLVSNPQVKIENLSLTGAAANNKIASTLSITGKDNIKKLQVLSSFSRDNETYTVQISPDDFYIMDSKWNVSKDNYVAFNKGGVLIHNIALDKSGSSVKVTSVNNRYNDDIDISIKNLQIEDISRIVEKDTSLARGTVDGHVFLKKVNNSYGIIADASINNLIIKEVPVGNFTLRAENPTTEKYNIDAKLSGPSNDVSIKGYFLPKAESDAMHFDIDIKSLALKTVEVLSMKKITSASGTATGKFAVRGSARAPDITGSLTFRDAFITPAALNSKLELKNETVELKKDGFYFNTFTILDTLGNPAVINGNVKMDHFKDPKFDLNVNTKNFLLFNTSSSDNKIYYGKMILNSRIKVAGDMNLPVVNARVKLQKGSNFTFAVPEKKLTTDKGEGVVIFIDSATFHPIITRNDTAAEEKTELTGFDISSIIEVDKEANLKLIIDPYSGDSLVVRGDAALSFALDPSGKMSLTGTYDLNDGSYLVSLESVLKRKFDIVPGSTIIWNGDPLDANLDITAIYSVRAAPVELIADQLSGLSETEQAAYKQRYPFHVHLKLKGEIMHPEISFEIQLPPEEKGILGGAVNAKLNMLNEDESALNKQVFALLVLGRFIQEDPLQTENSNVAGTMARTTVSKFLSAQLNQLSSKVVPGVELNFDVQSYDDYGSGSAQGRTEVEVGIKKQLFDERLSVQVGGSVDVEGEKAKQNSASDITSDVTLEYKLSKDGRYRLKGFRHNQYEGALEGQLVETGAGLLYIKDFDKWKDFLKPNRKRRSELEKKDKK